MFAYHLAAFAFGAGAILFFLARKPLLGVVWGVITYGILKAISDGTAVPLERTVGQTILLGLFLAVAFSIPWVEFLWRRK